MPHVSWVTVFAVAALVLVILLILGVL